MAARRVPSGGRLPRPVLSAEESTGQGVVGQEGNPRAVAEGQDAVFGVPVQEVVLVLHAGEARLPLGDGACGLFEQGHGEVGAADLADLALGDQFGRRAEGLGDGGLRVGVCSW